MRSYILSSNARRSLQEIKNYSQKKFGQQKTKLYLSALKNKMEMLVDDPLMGMHRPDIKDGYYSMLSGSHVIFYVINEDHTGTLDVLHYSQDVMKHLN